jgi:hypothetical protein
VTVKEPAMRTQSGGSRAPGAVKKLVNKTVVIFGE